MSSEVVVQLQYPITVEVGESKQQLTALTLRRLKVGALREHERRVKAGEIAGDLDESLFFIERMSGLSTETVEQLDPADFAAINDAVKELVPEGKAGAAGESK